jgi:AcrR family transcriptional regulator
MAPRPYRLRQRQTTVEQTRARIVAAARALLAAPGGFSGFTVDAVAAEAGVARMTLYNQFGSKMGLLEALFDDLAARGLLERLRAAFGRAEPEEVLDDLIAAFGGFWNGERIVIRRIRALASIDADFEQAVRARDERRRETFRTILGRFAEKHGKPSLEAREEVVNILHTLTSFETFDSLAGAKQTPADVMPLVRRLAHAVLQMDEGAAARGIPDTRSKRPSRRCSRRDRQDGVAGG